MIILGLTGSIGMGKSTTASMFADFGVPVYDADAAVHAIYAEGGAAVVPLSEVFPEAVQNNQVQRDILRHIITESPGRLRELEAVVHPLVAKSQIAFRSEAVANNAPLVVLDIPLLYETGGDSRCDYVAIVTTSAEEQKTRVLSRPGMTEQAFEQILQKQLPDAEKRARADFIINTGFGLDFARKHVEALIDLLQGMKV